MELGLLEDIGLTKGEIKVYLALLKLGTTTVTPIAKESNVSRSKIYLILESLAKKGLASYIIKENRRHFSAASPQRIIDYIEERKSKLNIQEREVKKLLPSLIKEQFKEKRTAYIYEGLKGVKTVFADILNTLKPNEEYLVVGAPLTPTLKRLNSYLQDWHRKRSRKKVLCKMIYRWDARPIGKIRTKIPLTHIKYLDEGYFTLAAINVYGDKTAIILWIEPPIAFVIENKEVTESFRTYFNLIWKIAKK